MKIWSILFVFVALAVALAACKSPTVVPENVTGNVVFQGSCPAGGNSSDPNCQIPENKTPIVTEINLTPTATEQQNEPKNVAYSITGVEGDLLAIKPNAYSPDGAKLSFSFSKPFNENGLWQTKEGDSGKYLITVTASDGQLSTSESVMVNVKPMTKAPIVECPDMITVKETETVRINCTIFDPQGLDLVVDYSGWMKGTVYQTAYGDAGDHTVVVRAANPERLTSKSITVHVDKVWRAPAFDHTIKSMTAMETDVVTLNLTASDPDGGNVTLTYSPPFSADGVWKTKIGDTGNYPISIVASNGHLSAKQEFTLKVNPINTAPVLKPIADITVSEGDTIHIPVEASDREGDPLVVSFSGFMTKDTYVTNYDDAYPKGCGYRSCTAHMITTVTVSDGQLTTSQDVNVYIKDKPRPPQFITQ